jgi:hypothetical protein
MSVKRILLIIVALCLLAGGIIGFYIYRKLNKPSQLPSHIPASAETIIYVNFKSIYNRFIHHRDSATKLRKFKNPYIQSIRDPLSTGIDFLSDAACVRYRHQWYMITMLDDESELTHTLEQMPDSLFDSIKKHKGFSSIRSKRDSFTLAWNKHLLVGFPKSVQKTDDAFIEEILAVNEENSFSREKTLGQSAKKDALAWFYTSGMDLKISTPSPLKGYVNWTSDNYLNVFATDHISATYPPSAAGMIPSDENYVYADTGNSFINKSLEALLLVYLPDQVEGIRKFNISKHPKMFCLGGQKTIENTSITYVYDDNFTKQKIVSTRIDTIRSARLHIFRPGSISVIVSNDRDTSRWMNDMPSPNIKLMAHFNQELLSPLYLFPPHTYDVRFIQTYDKGFNCYELYLKPGNLQQLLELQ